MRNVEKGNYVKVHYTGKYDSGEVFDSSSECQPLEIHVGSSEVIPGFENALLGMALNESKSFRLEPSEAYGDRNEELEQTFKRSDFPADFKPEIGQVLVLQDSQSGQFPAVVKSIEPESVVLDLNHPLAGKSLNFEIEVVEINDQPTPSACGCGCSGCS